MKIQSLPWGPNAKALVATAGFFGLAALVTGVVMTILHSHSILTLSLMGSGGGVLGGLFIYSLIASCSKRRESSKEVPYQEPLPPTQTTPKEVAESLEKSAPSPSLSGTKLTMGMFNDLLDDVRLVKDEQTGDLSPESQELIREVGNRVNSLSQISDNWTAADLATALNLDSEGVATLLLSYNSDEETAISLKLGASLEDVKTYFERYLNFLQEK